MKNYCTQLAQQQTGSVRWKRLDDIVTKFRCTYENRLQYTPARCMEQTLVCKFANCCQQASIAAFASNFGRIELYDFKSKKKLCHFWPVEYPIFDLAWIPGQMRLLSVGNVQKLTLWDFAGEPRAVVAFDQRNFGANSYYDGITSVAVSKENPHLCAFGVAGQGQIEFWDTRNSHQRIAVIYDTHKYQTCLEVHIRRAVAGLVFKDVNSVISCAGNEENIKMWDFRNVKYDRATGKPTPKQTFMYKGNLAGTGKVGFSSLAIDDYGLKLYANCTDTHIYCFNVNSNNPEPIMKYQDMRHSCHIPYDYGSHIRLALSSDGSHILNGCCDNSAFIWSTKYSYPVVKLNHDNPVCCVAWQRTCDYDQVVLTCDRSQVRNVWRISTPKSDTDPKFDPRARCRDVDVCPVVPYQLRLENDGKILDTRVRACKKCFNASTDVFCKKCMETQLTKFMRGHSSNRFSPYFT